VFSKYDSLLHLPEASIDEARDLCAIKTFAGKRCFRHGGLAGIRNVLNLKQPVSTYAAVPRLRTSVISRLPQLTSDVIHTRRYVHALCQIVCEFDTQRNVLLASH